MARQGVIADGIERKAGSPLYYCVWELELVSDMESLKGFKPRKHTWILDFR